MIKSKDSGFSFIEVMVAVAVAGIVVSIAVPNYKKYNYKTRSAEAKIKLSEIFVSQKVFHANYYTYASCLGAMKINTTQIGYYAAGFRQDHRCAGCVANIINTVGSAENCPPGEFNYPATRSASVALPATADLFNTLASAITADNFTAISAGTISEDFLDPDDADAWSVNENKLILHTRIGY